MRVVVLPTSNRASRRAKKVFLGLKTPMTSWRHYVVTLFLSGNYGPMHFVWSVWVRRQSSQKRGHRSVISRFLTKIFFANISGTAGPIFNRKIALERSCYGLQVCSFKITIWVEIKKLRTKNRWDALMTSLWGRFFPPSSWAKAFKPDVQLGHIVPCRSL